MTNFLMDNFVFMDDFAIKKGWFPSTRKPTFWDFAGPFLWVVSPYQPFFSTIHYTSTTINNLWNGQARIVSCLRSAWADSCKLFSSSSPAVIDQHKWGYHHWFNMDSLMILGYTWMCFHRYSTIWQYRSENGFHTMKTLPFSWYGNNNDYINYICQIFGYPNLGKTQMGGGLRGDWNWRPLKKWNDCPMSPIFLLKILGLKLNRAEIWNLQPHQNCLLCLNSTFPVGAVPNPPSHGPSTGWTGWYKGF